MDNPKKDSVSSRSGVMNTCSQGPPSSPSALWLFACGRLSSALMKVHGGVGSTEGCQALPLPTLLGSRVCQGPAGCRSQGHRFSLCRSERFGVNTGVGKRLGQGRLRPARRWQPGSLRGVCDFRSKGVPRKRLCWASPDTA